MRRVAGRPTHHTRPLTPCWAKRWEAPPSPSLRQAATLCWAGRGASALLFLRLLLLPRALKFSQAWPVKDLVTCTHRRREHLPRSADRRGGGGGGSDTEHAGTSSKRPASSHEQQHAEQAQDLGGGGCAAPRIESLDPLAPNQRFRHGAHVTRLTISFF
jgi:hypothetical protein